MVQNNSSPDLQARMSKKHHHLPMARLSSRLESSSDRSASKRFCSSAVLWMRQKLRCTMSSQRQIGVQLRQEHLKALLLQCCAPNAAESAVHKVAANHHSSLLAAGMCDVNAAAAARVVVPSCFPLHIQSMMTRILLCTSRRSDRMMYFKEGSEGIALDLTPREAGGMPLLPCAESKETGQE